MKLYRTISGAFAKAGWELNVSHRGLIIRSKVLTKYHSVILTDYSLGRGGAESLLPRLKVNTHWGKEPITAKLRKAWRIDDGSKGLFEILNLEITTLPAETFELAVYFPALVEEIEKGADSDFGKAFPVPFIKITETNIWTDTARAYDRENGLRTGRLKLSGTL